MQRSEIRYAKAHGHHIAYRELVGDPDSDCAIVMVTGANFPMDSLPDDPLANRLIEGLAALGRLVMFDRRGIGLSDPPSEWDRPLREQWEEDLLAVIDAAGLARPTVFSWLLSPVAAGFATRWPDRVDRLVLFNPAPPVEAADEAWLNEYRERAKDVLDGPAFNTILWPNRWADPAFRDWHDAAGRAGASPSQAARQLDATMNDVAFDYSAVPRPTLVISRIPPERPFGMPDEVWLRPGRSIPGATAVALADGDFFPFGIGVDQVLGEISQYTTGRIRLPDPERHLAAIMFTDLVDSTRRASLEGDAAWKQLLDRHDHTCLDITHRFGGEVVKTTGDGALAIFPSARAAVDAARTVRGELEADQLSVRIGIHVGEVDRRGDDVSGLAVNLAARIMSEAGAGQILVSDLVERIADVGPSSPIGSRAVKGFDTPVELFELAQDGTGSPPET